MTKRSSKRFLYWTPRALAILFVLFVSIFAFDVFEEYSGFELIIALLMHLIPSIILLVLLLISWRWELTGGILWVILCIVFTIFFKLYEDVIVFLIIGLPVLTIGILFILSYFLSKKNL